MNEKSETPKISNKAKKFAQENWKKSFIEVMDLLDKPENVELLGEKKLIFSKINGIRKDQRQKENPQAPKNDLVISEEGLATVETTAVAEKPASKKQPNGGKLLWEWKEPQENETGIKETVITPKKERGHIISLLEATREKPLRRKIKKLIGDENIKMEICIYAGIQDPIGIEMSVDEAKIDEADGAMTIQIGDLRITGVPAEEITGEILRGLFNLDIVTIRRSDEGKRAFYPKLAFVKHPNGTRPVHVVTVDKEKKEPSPGSYHTTPSFNGDIVHFEQKTS